MVRQRFATSLMDATVQCGHPYRAGRLGRARLGGNVQRSINAGFSKTHSREAAEAPVSEAPEAATATTAAVSPR